MSADVVTFGETMVLLEAGSSGPLRYVNTFNKRFGGAESNVAIGLSKLGHQSLWMSKVGQDEFGEFLIQKIRGEGVNTDHVTSYSGAPTGLYFKEMRRPGDQRVAYYRSGSAASFFTETDLDEEQIAQTKILHLTGITALLSESCRTAIFKAIEVAKAHNVLVSFDPNLRYTLMGQLGEDGARQVIRDIAAKADLVMPGLDEAEWLYGTSDETEVADLLFAEGVQKVVIKNGGEYSFYAENGGAQGRVPSFEVKQIVDAIGAGDGFAAGVLSGLLDKKSLEESVHFAAAVGALVISSPGDIEGLPTRSEVLTYIEQKEGHSGGVLR
ncbi:sugar kinase [Alkalicoccobacillus murimartini]|uniref:2-dehydro-3-deoxygluconokinase n=1 Tax=Alkalicoccobacillus murimartini TaxID=171685 RepID=A0ABT9YD73_9BACI|nr:sugar kinase [Alkalicoccobacillus murimartini]MDQ0205674.1 2-dehydro-3-deoxygluconokinase [Alkalicoccobacillus murimartini]